jgi:zinc protease
MRRIALRPSAGAHVPKSHHEWTLILYKPYTLARRASPAILLALLVAAARLLAPDDAHARVFDPKTFTLTNGLQVVVVSDHRVPIVSHMVWYKVGAADEPEGHSGLAHLLEHLMFKGTPNIAQGEFSRIVARNGGQENAFTSYDYTAYFQNIAKDRLELVMGMEADRMTNLTLTEAQVAPEKLVVLEERRMRTDNDPGAVLSEEAQAVSYLNHPYRRPVIGWESEIAALTPSEALDFYRHWYAPNNAIVVVTGDITPEEIRPLAERTYGRIAAAEVRQRSELQEPPQHTERRVALTDARVRQPSWTRSWPAPSYRYGAAVHAYPLQVLEEILGGGATSRLYRKLVVEQALAVSADASYEPSRRGPTMLVISASPRPGVTLEQLEQAVAGIAREIVEAGVTDEEVERAKQRMVADAVYARDSYSTAAYIIGEALAIGQTIDDVEAWPDRVRAVSRQQVEEAARLVLDEPAVTSLLIAGNGGGAEVTTAPDGAAIR